MAKNLVSGLILANWAQILAAIPPPQKKSGFVRL